uniref:Uncharacterized protein n=1 Tax=Lepeophtheirus salmonis TaxID=72036 RepID=A0A0K2UTM7_LEPSM
MAKLNNYFFLLINDEKRRMYNLRKNSYYVYCNCQRLILF